MSHMISNCEKHFQSRKNIFITYSFVLGFTKALQQSAPSCIYILKICIQTTLLMNKNLNRYYKSVLHPYACLQSHTA